MRRFKQSIGFALSRLAILIAIISLFAILLFVFVRGFKVLSPSFLFQFPKAGMTKGGILPAIIGTLYLSIGAIIFALPLGVLGAIYLTEYAKAPRLIRIIRIGINNLAGTPSVVFGLFGLAVFVKLFGFGVSILAGSLTLDQVMALPYHIYALMTEGTKPDLQVPIAYGTAVVLVLLVLGINVIAISIRIRGRRAKKW